jgi:hypothetical protein
MLLCVKFFPILLISASLVTLAGLGLRYRFQLQRSKEAEFDWNLQLLAVLSVLAFLGLGIFVASLFIRFGRC